MVPITISAERGTLEEVMLGLKQQHLLPVVVSVVEQDGELGTDESRQRREF